MIITENISEQFRKVGLALDPGAQLSGQGYLGHHCFLTKDAALYSCSIGAYSGIRTNHVDLLYLGNYCSVADEVKVVGDHDYNRLSTSICTVETEGKHWVFSNFKGQEPYITYRAVAVGHDVWIGTRVTMRGGIRIGDGAVIGAGSVVTHDVEPYTIVVGCPARPLKRRFADEKLIERIHKSKWFLYDWDGIDVQWADAYKAIDIMEKRLATNPPPLANTGFTYKVDEAAGAIKLTPAQIVEQV